MECTRLDDDSFDRQVWVALDVDGRDLYQIRSQDGAVLLQIWFRAGVDRSQAYNALNSMAVD